jgi:hypothetical protein
MYLWGRGFREFMEIWTAYGTGAYLRARGLALGDGPLAILDVIVDYVRGWQLLVWLCLAGAFSALMRRRRVHAAGVVFAFLLSSVAAALVQGKLFEYHWIPILPPMAILSSVSLVWLRREIGGQADDQRYDMRSVFGVVVIVGLLLLMGYDHLSRYRRLLAYATGRLSAERYYAQFDIGGDFSHEGAHSAAMYLRDHTKPDETAMIWGVEPLINFLSGRRSPTSYISFYVLIPGEGSDSYLEGWREDFMGDIRERQPTYIILVENDITPLAPTGSLSGLAEFPAFKTMLDTAYAFETQVEDYLFYRHRGSAGVTEGA